ncbi:MAG TPA: 2Fe-2S iron-sulfur cluster-binding protein [Myxococcota bacterium]|nr:2Fe-2S iron-sulfur cluster-binding protein [Myxococcota bacterium]
MVHSRRIDPFPGNPRRRGNPVKIQFEGRSIDGYEGESVAMALIAAGINVFGRSIKYHRPRGPWCLAGHCSGCLMRIEGTPNVRSCETACRSGLVVERQAGWPGAGFDLLRAVDWLSGERLDHHSMFTASSGLNRLAARFVRRLSGYGDPPGADPPAAVPIKETKAGTVIVGAGAAGLSAALSLAGAGHELVLFENSPRVGGRLLDAATRLPGSGGRIDSGWERLQEIEQSLGETPGIELHAGTVVLAIYPGERFEVLAGNSEQTFLVRAERLIICTGAYEQLPLFANNDLPGLFGVRALDRLVCGHGVVPGEPLVVVGDSERALRLADLLAEHDVALSGVVTRLRQGEAIDRLRARGLPIFFGHRLTGARGGRRLDRIELAPEDGADADLVLDCRTCAVEAPAAPAYELAHHAGCRVGFASDSGYRVTTDDDGLTSHGRVFAAGHCARARSTEEALLHGERAGQSCALSIRAEVS